MTSGLISELPLRKGGVIVAGTMDDSSKSKVTESWLKFLNPESLRGNLLAASLYLAAYEVLRSSIIDQIKTFYTSGWSATSGFLVDDEYEKKVLGLHKSHLRASALWLQQRSVIDTNDLEKLDQIREHRNAIAHDLPHFVSAADTSIDPGLFQSIYELITKIDQWWIREVEIPTNGDFDEREIDFDNVQSGNMIFMHLLINITLAPPESADFYYRQFQEHFGGGHKP
jgi:hypothetical protein